MISSDLLMIFFVETKSQDISKNIATNLYFTLNEIKNLKILKIFFDKIFDC